MTDRQKATNQRINMERAARRITTLCEVVAAALKAEGRAIAARELRELVDRHDPSGALHPSDNSLRTVRQKLIDDGVTEEYIDHAQRNSPRMIRLVGQGWTVRGAKLDGLADSVTIALTGHPDDRLFVRVRAALVEAIVAHGGVVDDPLPMPPGLVHPNPPEGGR